MMIMALRAEINRRVGDTRSRPPVIVSGCNDGAKLIRAAHATQDIGIDIFGVRVVASGTANGECPMGAVGPFAVIGVLRAVVAIAAHCAQGIDDRHHGGIGIIGGMGGGRTVAAFTPYVDLKVTGNRSGIVDGGMALDTGLGTGILGTGPGSNEEGRCQKHDPFAARPDSRDATPPDKHN